MSVKCDVIKSFSLQCNDICLSLLRHLGRAIYTHQSSSAHEVKLSMDTWHFNVCTVLPYKEVLLVGGASRQPYFNLKIVRALFQLSDFSVIQVSLNMNTRL